MLRKTKEQNTSNIFFGVDSIEDFAKVSQDKALKKDESQSGANSIERTENESLSQSFFGLGKLAETIKVADEMSKQKANDIRNSKENLDRLAEEQKSRKLSGFDPKISNGSSIISADAAEITDMGGPSKHIMTPLANSIFDVDRNARNSQKIDSKTATKIEKEQIQTNRRNAENERMDDLVKALQTTDQTNASAAHRTSTGEVEVPYSQNTRNTMSIFDDDDFARLPEKTAGEKVSKRVAEENAQIDDSWRGSGKSLTSSEITRNFVDNIFEQLDKSGS